MSTNEDISTGFAGGLIAAALLVVVGGAYFSINSSLNHRARCETACQRAMPRTYGDGLCVCKNGRVYAWQEGYTRRLGGVR
jgi:hypothetical protein